MIYETFARVLALFAMLVGPVGLANGSDVQSDGKNLQSVAQPTELCRVIRVTVDYYISGMPEGTENFSWNEWVSFRDALSDEDRAILQSQLSVTAQATVGGLTIISSTDGSLSMFSDLGSADGEVQFVYDKGLVVILQDMDGAVRADWVWQGSRTDNFLSLETKSDDKVVGLDVKQTGETNELWFGSRTFSMSINPKEMSVIGADLQMGNARGLWGWITGGVAGAAGVVAGSVATIAYTAKCIKDGLWDSYDCTPGTIACRCNGCVSC